MVINYNAKRTRYVTICKEFSLPLELVRDVGLYRQKHVERWKCGMIYCQINFVAITIFFVLFMYDSGMSVPKQVQY